MGDVVYSQTLTAVAGKNPEAGSPLKDKDFEVTQEVTTITDLNEDAYQRFSVDPGTVDLELCKGTISTIKLTYIKPLSDLKVKLVAPDSSFCEYTLYAGRPSIFNMELSTILVSNSTSVPIKGVVFFAGD